jgi:hypothetical protein
VSAEGRNDTMKKSQLEEVEEFCHKKVFRKFYQDVKSERKKFQRRNKFCGDKEGNVRSEGIGIRKRCEEYFSDMFKTSEIEAISNTDEQTHQRALGRCNTGNPPANQLNRNM